MNSKLMERIGLVRDQVDSKYARIAKEHLVGQTRWVAYAPTIQPPFGKKASETERPVVPSRRVRSIG